MKPTLLAKGERGFSLVEMMVAVLIGMLGIIVIFQVFAASENTKRTSTSGGDAQQNGLLSLYTIERDVRQAGYGFNYTPLLGCTLRAYDNTKAPSTLPVFTLAPVIITQGAGNAPDTLVVIYGNSDLITNPVSLTQDMASATVPFRVNDRYGFTLNDLVIAAEPGKDCSLAQITQIPTAAGATDNVLHDANGARFNKAGGLGVTYTTNGKLYNIGNQPVQATYSVVNEQLNMQSLFVADAATADVTIADNIVQLQAEYGRDDGVNNGTVKNAAFSANDGIVDNYNTTTPATAAQWTQVLSVRLALLARSSLAEKPNTAGGPCDATTVASVWSGGVLDASADANWNCYRYKIFETVVPIRNLIWPQS